MLLRSESSVGVARRAPAVSAVLVTALLFLSLSARPVAAQGEPASDPAPQAEPPVDDPDAPPADPADPMSNEEPGEDAPATDMTVPPKQTYGGQAPFEPAQILWSSVTAAERKLADAEAAKRDAIIEVRNLRKRRKELGSDQKELGRETVDAVDELAAAGERLATRAVFGYQRFGSGSGSDAEMPQDVSDYQQVVDAQRRSKMISSALEVDESDIDRLDKLRAGLGVDTLVLLERSRLVADYLIDAEGGIAELDAAIDQAAIEYEAFRAGSEVFIHGVVFPIAGPYPRPLVDSFGFPRMPGTPDEHWHEGIDLFAARGAPLVATERGVITKKGSGRLGGLKFWLKGESGSEWYYAHLDSFAPGLHDGLVVEAGQLVGYVGTTGNAVGTPPHLHMQLHPGGDRPVNPYPLLKVVSDLDQARIAAGTHPGYEYTATVVDRPEPEPEPEPAPDPAPEPKPAPVAPSSTIVAATTAPSIKPEATTTPSSKPEATTALSSKPQPPGSQAD